MRRARIAPMSAKRRAGLKLWRAAKQAALARDSWSCVLCMATAVDVHHRKQKSLGGTDNPENTVSLCRAHHDDIHRNIALYEPLGLLLHAWEPEADSPMWHHRARKWCQPGASYVWLGSHGGPGLVADLDEHLLAMKVSAIVRGLS